ncbi:MAG: helix-turn-helix transcriptional regulator [Treponema sp.]|jgi:transcriptional regulator with XRE-family HTH domain|nr:helix-turn-helix transcriptional regulator [Treponema sp.]
MTDDEAKLRKSLSANIRHYRAKYSFSQEKLAEIVGLSDQTINDIEGCRTWVSDKTIVKISRALNVEVYQLLFPQTEADKLFPVKVPADILNNLKDIIKEDLDRRFNEVVVSNI